MSATANWPHAASPKTPCSAVSPDARHRGHLVPRVQLARTQGQRTVRDARGGASVPYLNIDDGMDEHPKVEGLSDAAFRMYVAGMLYSARRGTDGAIPRAKARRLS